MSSSTNGSSYSPNSHESSGSSFFDALVAKPIALVTVLLAILVIAAVFVGMRNSKEAKTQAAGNALFHAQRSYENEMKAFAASVAPAPPAANEKGAKDKKAAAAPSPESVLFTKTDVDAKFPETLKGYKAVVDQYSGTRAAFEALLAMGALYSNHGEPAKAVSWLQKATESAPSSADRAEAYFSLGYALEGSGKYSEAVQAYQNAMSAGEPVAKADLLLAIARNQDLMGDKAKSGATYDQIIKEYPNSDQAHTAVSLKAQK
jgi:tetratricopeptide (TPR) repeat protein